VTRSSNFPTTAGAFQTVYGGGLSDGFVAKVNSTGTGLAYSTYIGGSGEDGGPTGIAVDAAGNAYVAGITASTDFPTTAGAFQTAFAGSPYDAFVTKVNPTGTGLVYSTYLGGNSYDQANGIAVDSLPTPNVYVIGVTASGNFPTTAGAFQTTLAGPNDAVVTKVNPTGTGLVYSTYLGGSSQDIGRSIAVDAAGNAYVAGHTQSIDFPITVGAFQTALAGGWDAVVTKVNPTGTALVYSTYLGGSSDDFGYGLTVDSLSSPNAYVTGASASTNFPTTSGAVQATYGGGTLDAVVTKVNPTGTGLVYSTYLGGSSDDQGVGIALDSLPSPNAYVTGATASTNFPVTAGVVQSTSGGGYDAFVAKIGASQPPVCSAAQANPAALWSPNHQFVPIMILGVTDPGNNPVTITVLGVRQDEPVLGPGSGNTSPDAIIQGGSASVRAERDGNGNGRVYHLAFQADNGHGGTCTGDVTVGVPHSQGKGVIAIDDGPIYDSTVA
jgi:hypothetical protein